ncbi:hypothetical protein ELH63_31190 (plasmid) [Rhizobium ruizarguesonis]|nr:hypothetical protein ELH63_31190 [Rhizobium ruizarguesonis]
MISTSSEPSSFLVTDGFQVDDTGTSIHGKRTVLESLVLGGERGPRRKCPVLSGGDPKCNCAKSVFLANSPDAARSPSGPKSVIRRC